MGISSARHIFCTILISVGILAVSITPCRADVQMKILKEPDRVRGLPRKDQVNKLDTQGRVYVLFRGHPNRREVAITFDDGPHPPFTQRLLAMLKQLGVRATFFVVGRIAEKHPEILKQMVSDGHEVANHSYTHPKFSKLSYPEMVQELVKTNKVITKITGKPVRSFRAPGGDHSPKTISAAKSLNMTLVLWTNSPADFEKVGSQVLASRTLNHLHNGADILLHDGIEETMEMLPLIVGRLRSQGYRFITIEEMTRHLEAPQVAQQPRDSKFR